MEYTYAEPLQAGDTIAVVAPSSALAGDDVIKASPSCGPSAMK